MLGPALLPLALLAIDPPAQLRAQLASVADGDVVLHARVEPARVGAGVGLVVIEGEIDGVPIDRPLGAWVTTPASSRVIALRDPGPLRRAPIVVDRDEAIAEVGADAGSSAELRWHDGTLVWRVQGTFDPIALRHPVFEVNANTGAVRRIHDHVRDAQIRAWPQNPVTTPELGTFETIDLAVDAQTLVGPRLRATSCVAPDGGLWSGLDSCGLAQAAHADANGDFLLDPASDRTPVYDDAFAEASLYSHADRFTAAMLEHGITQWACLTIDGPLQLALVANYHVAGPTPYDNAHYTGWCNHAIVMGQGPDADASYDGDVVYHEVGHAVVHAAAGSFLGTPRRRADAYVFDADAINEAYADFFSTTFTDDPVHAEYWSGGSRNLDNELACADSYVGEAHVDSLAFSGALWRLYESHGDVAIDLVLDSIALLAEDATFEEAAAALVAVTEAGLGASAGAAIAAELEARALLDCPRIRAYEPDLALRLAPRDEFTGWAPPPLQIVIDVPDDAGELSFQMIVVDEATTTPQPLDAVLRRGAPLEFVYTGADAPYSIEVEHDHAVVDQPFVQRVTMPVVGGEPVYLAPVNPSLEWRGVLVTDVQFVSATDESGSSSDEGDASDESTTSGASESTSAAPTDESSSSEGTESTTAHANDDAAGCSCNGGGVSTAMMPWLVLARRRRRATGS